MLAGFRGVAWPAIVAFTAGWRLAHADIYRWVDPSGRVNISNMPPPEGARVMSVTHEVPQPIAARYDAAREAARQAELQGMSERIRQLESEVEVAQRPVAPPPIQYVPVPIPAPAPVQYAADPAPPAPSGCDP